MRLWSIDGSSTSRASNLRVSLLRKRRREIVTRWLPLGIWVTIIFVFSQLPGSEASVVADSFDYRFMSPAVAYHIGVYLVLSVMIWRLASHCWPYARVLLYLIVSSASIAYGVSDELHQMFVPGRSFQISDIVFNSVGVLIGTIMVAAIPIIRKKDRRQTRTLLTCRNPPM